MSTDIRASVFTLNRLPVMAPPPVKRLTLDLTPALHRSLKIRAAELEIPMAELLRELLESALNEPRRLAAAAKKRRR